MTRLRTTTGLRTTARLRTTTGLRTTARLRTTTTVFSTIAALPTEVVASAPRLQYIVTAGEALEALDAHREPPAIGPVLSALKTVSRYVQLQPSFMGVGIKFNSIIDDMVTRAEERARREREEYPTYLSAPHTKRGYS
jgi:hypothetical protein